MFKKFGIGMLAVVMACAFSAFTAPKQKDALKHTADLYWYNVDLSSQLIPQNATYTEHVPEDQVEECEVLGSEKDCKRGFSTVQNTSAGPISARGDAQKMTIQQ